MLGDDSGSGGGKASNGCWQPAGRISFNENFDVIGELLGGGLFGGVSD